MNPVLPSARWHPTIYSRRPYMGQGQTPPQPFGTLVVHVQKDGKPFAGAEIEIMLMNGESKKGTTTAEGIFPLPYSQAQQGQAVVRITPPADVQDLGEGSAQGVDLKGGTSDVKFELVGTGGAAYGPSPVLGLGVAGGLYALALWAL